MSFQNVAILLPYVLEALNLASQTIQILSKDDVSEEDFEALKARFEASQASRDEALGSLREAIDRARSQ